MTENSLIASAQAKLDDARRQIKDAVVNFEIPDETILALRKSARRALDELNRLERQTTKKGLLAQIKFW
jgi:hypothetical protein